MRSFQLHFADFGCQVTTDIYDDVERQNLTLDETVSDISHLYCVSQFLTQTRETHSLPLLAPLPNRHGELHMHSVPQDRSSNIVSLYGLLEPSLCYGYYGMFPGGSGRQMEQMSECVRLVWSESILPIRVGITQFI